MPATTRDAPPLIDIGADVRARFPQPAAAKKRMPRSAFVFRRRFITRRVVMLTASQRFYQTANTNRYKLLEGRPTSGSKFVLPLKNMSMASNLLAANGTGLYSTDTRDHAC
jgi:hypothetical protein